MSGLGGVTWWSCSFAGAGGVLAFRRSIKPVTIHWHRIIALELAAFLTLALLSALNGNPLSEGSMWGGQVGWGLAMVLARYIGPIWGGLVILVSVGIGGFDCFWTLESAGELAASTGRRRYLGRACSCFNMALKPMPLRKIRSFHRFHLIKLQILPAGQAKNLPRNYRLNSANLSRWRTGRTAVRPRHYRAVTACRH